MKKTSHYPSFSVMKEQDAWDDHTQRIVQSRLETSWDYTYVNLEEVAALQAISCVLVADSRGNILLFVVRHIDATLSRSNGESQRKPGVPEAKTLIREGLKRLQQMAQIAYANRFENLDTSAQRSIVQMISEGRAEPASVWSGFPESAFFQKLLTLVTEAYCSHPDIWSEMGYAGPAYPRGYVRTEIDQIDPWEAKSER